ncbi:probable leucine-rich repeat receptor-like protein kinase At5g49770 [Phalaenopsis equestris]|uniref:probable leucine-rich repeat receptor-like protein kinase At5g49770 n=1 Tax=Phalaenopsis equestris TaxID=78828 RepID=UPI0009E4E270|nr:probable leucine-rich repeat receptor-like protein kinase At5g49770 [Phalaenopsis equestris]
MRLTLKFYASSSATKKSASQEEDITHNQKGLRMFSRFFLLFAVFAAGLQGGLGDTNPQDAAALRSLMSQWQNTPPSWGNNDPCSTPWEGIVCSDSRVTMLTLNTMGIKGTLSSDISQLTQLQSLDLSLNSDLGGPIPPSIENLKQLTTLILAGCSFTGNIPQELGNMAKLSFLALNSNKLTGRIPSSMGLLSNLYWFDLGDNQLTGVIPVSSNSTPGLDQLVNTKHFHFNKNQLSGAIPESLFSSKMTLIHLLFDSNKFTGQIPESLGLVKSLEVLRLDRNSLGGTVPSNINNLVRLNELSLANNELTGSIPDLTGMSLLNYVDLSNNSFDPSPAPNWFSTLETLTTLVLESGGLYGNIPTQMFSFPQMQQVLLSNNAFNGTLDLDKTSSELQLVDFKNNAISGFKSSPGFSENLILYGNPVCTTQLVNSIYCSLQQELQQPYSTNLSHCNSPSCPLDQSVNPKNCECAYPYEGWLVFRAPFFRDTSNSSRFQELENSLWTQLKLSPHSVSLSNLLHNRDNYLQVDAKLFPSRMYFNRLEVIKIGFALSNQSFDPPSIFGPYYFIASAYPFSSVNNGGGSSMSTGVIAGIAIGCVLLLIVLFVVGIYALRQKRRAQRAVEQSKPYASWLSAGKESDGAPQLKGARYFSYEELRKSTNNFAEANEIGSGGYGKVYKGYLSSGEVVAVKRAQQGSMQGGHEFKTEIELLSRVHHKNLVGLVGFCFEQGEQMLVYEYIPNGTLRESLIGKNGIKLDWPRRLKVALGSARGLAYLHELADPPIIHRDVKSTNILLDENLIAKVADFGLSKLVSDSQKGHISTQVKGTLGYLDPEYYMTQQLTEKSDVYSFGVVMLELIIAKQPIEKGKYIVREVRMTLNEKDNEYYGLREMMDPALRSTTNLTGFRRFVELAMQCVEESAAQRPTMNQLVKEIETLLQNAGLSSNANSTPSSATDFGSTTNAHHPYNEPLPGKELHSDSSFDYTGGYSFASRIEPK